jgi:hypothetical protein
MNSKWKANPINLYEKTNSETTDPNISSGEDSTYSWIVVIAAFITGFISGGYFFSFGNTLSRCI